MNNNFPNISIIIPTHNRKDSLIRSLDSLHKQSYPLNKFEVIVVADGCTDGTIKMIKNYKPLFSLKLIEQSNQGASVARNNGALKASGPIFIFLDDDIETFPELVEAHVFEHQEESHKVVIGNLPPILQNQKGFFLANLREWWENMFWEMSQKGHRFNYRNLLSGNFSISTKLFNEVGGFNTTFKCQEDYELGVRLIEAGAMFTFAHNARGYHHEKTDLKRSFNRKYEEGKSAILFSVKYPEIIPSLPLLGNSKNEFPLYYQRLLRLIYSFPTILDKFAVSFEYVLFILEILRMRRTWQKLLNKLFAYWYLRGVAEDTGNLPFLKNLLQGTTDDRPQDEPEIEINLKDGLQIADNLLDKFRPSKLIIRYGTHTVGIINPKFGYEPLRAVHLRSILLKDLAEPLIKAINADKKTNNFLWSKFSTVPINELEINGRS